MVMAMDMKASGCFKAASLMLQVDDHNIIDDESFDQADFLRRVAASPNCPKSSCPSPEAYRSAFDCDADHIFAVTLSAKLSCAISPSGVDTITGLILSAVATKAFTLLKRPFFLNVSRFSRTNQVLSSFRDSDRFLM